MNVNGQSDTNEVLTEEDDKFAAISRAMSEGDHAALDRLMAAEEGDDSTDVVDTDKEEDDTQVDSDVKTENDTPAAVASDEASDVTEAASSAASPDKPGVDSDAEALKTELHRLRSDAGRVPYLQRRLSELERELRAQQARAPEATANGTKTTKNVEDVELDEQTARDLAALKEIDPILATTMERVAKSAIAAANSRVDHVVTTFTQADAEQEDNRLWIEQKAELTRLIPQHEQIFALPEYQQWKASLTPGRRAMAESIYADEVAMALQAFAADMQRTRGNTNQQVAQPAQVTPPVQQPVSAEPTAVQEARNRKVATSAEVKNPSAKVSAPLNEEDYFREMYQKLGKQNHILP